MERTRAGEFGPKWLFLLYSTPSVTTAPRVLEASVKFRKMYDFFFSKLHWENDSSEAETIRKPNSAFYSPTPYFVSLDEEEAESTEASKNQWARHRDRGGCSGADERRACRHRSPPVSHSQLAMGTVTALVNRAMITLINQHTNGRKCRRCHPVRLSRPPRKHSPRRHAPQWGRVTCWASQLSLILCFLSPFSHPLFVF